MARRGSPVQVVLLLVLAPICAEYLSAYDDSTGHPAVLIGNLIVFVPLYGAPALLIRELARRYGLGWVGIVALGVVFGLLQAGVVDQSLFDTDYRDIPGWEASYGATLIAPWGVSAFNLLNFVGGHAIVSMAAPIALVEATRPRTAAVPWLPGVALIPVVLGWVGASLLIMWDFLTGADASASRTQLAVTVGLAVVVVVAAVGRPLLLRRRGSRPSSTRSAPNVVLVGLLALLLSFAYGGDPETWPGVAVVVVALITVSVGVGLGSTAAGWSRRHVVVVAAAPLLARAVLAFGYDPLLGSVSPAAKYGHNVIMLLIVVVITVWALRAQRQLTPLEPVPAAPGRAG